MSSSLPVVTGAMLACADGGRLRSSTLTGRTCLILDPGRAWVRTPVAGGRDRRAAGELWRNITYGGEQFTPVTHADPDGGVLVLRGTGAALGWCVTHPRFELFLTTATRGVVETAALAQGMFGMRAVALGVAHERTLISATPREADAFAAMLDGTHPRLHVLTP